MKKISKAILSASTVVLGLMMGHSIFASPSMLTINSNVAAPTIALVNNRLSTPIASRGSLTIPWFSGSGPSITGICGATFGSCNATIYAIGKKKYLKAGQLSVDLSSGAINILALWDGYNILPSQDGAGNPTLTLIQTNMLK